MRHILVLLSVVFIWTHADATTPTLTSITQPLFYLGSAGDVEIQFIETPKIINNAGVMFWVELFHSPTEIKRSDGDMNLISIYGFTVSLTEHDTDGRPTLITIDSSKAMQPPRYPFTVDEVAEAAVKAVRIEFPDKDNTKIEVKGRSESAEKPQGEQDEALKP